MRTRTSFDLDSKVTLNPDDFLPEYLQGRPTEQSAMEILEKYKAGLQPFENIDLWTGQWLDLRSAEDVRSNQGIMENDSG